MKKYLTEFIGSFALVFCATSAAVVNTQTNGSLGTAGCAAVSGLTLTALIYALGKSSGAHFNPALSAAMVLLRLFPLKELLPYIVSQFAGAAAAGLLANWIFHTNMAAALTLPTGGVAEALVLEILISFMLGIVIFFSSAEENTNARQVAGFSIGFAVIVGIMIAASVSGGSMNPLRSFAPALAAWHWQHLWIYLLAPTLGFTAAGFSWKNLRLKS
jgi:aquaporin NIP